MNTTKMKTLLAAIPVAAGLLAMGSGAAMAADGPTTRELLSQCQRADVCQFHPAGAPSIHDGQSMSLGSLQNCTKSPAKLTVSKSATEGTSNSFGVEISATTKIGQSFEASVTASYHREWNWSSTTASGIEQEVAPHSKVNVFAAKQKSRINGNYELHFSKKYYGHYIWYSASGWVDGQTGSQPWSYTTRPVSNTC